MTKNVKVDDSPNLKEKNDLVYSYKVLNGLDHIKRKKKSSKKISMETRMVWMQVTLENAVFFSYRTREYIIH